jgi:hypothetical protein
MELLFVALVVFLSLGGVVVGIQTPLWIQIIVSALIILVLNSSIVRRHEIGALPTIAAGILFIFGMLIGNAMYLIQTRNLDVDIRLLLNLFNAPP